MPLLAALLLLLSIPCLATVTIDSEHAGPINLSSATRYLEDNSNSLNLQDILALPGSQWQAYGDNTFSMGYSTSTWWLTFNLANTSPEEVRHLLEVGYPGLDHLAVHMVWNGKIDVFVMGDALPFEREKFVDLFSTEDQREGVNAFLEKRSPVWKNA